MVPDEFIKIPPKDHLIQTLYVKHVEIRGRWVQQPMRYDKVEGGNLILDYLISAKGPQVRLNVVLPKLPTITRNLGHFEPANKVSGVSSFPFEDSNGKEADFVRNFTQFKLC